MAMGALDQDVTPEIVVLTEVPSPKVSDPNGYLAILRPTPQGLLEGVWSMGTMLKNPGWV